MPAIKKLHLNEGPGRASVVLPQLTKCRRRHPENGGEYAGEMELVGEPQFLSHLLYQRAGFLKSFGGMIDLEAQ